MANLIGLIMKKFKTLLNLFKKHYSAFKKERHARLEVFRYAKEITNREECRRFIRMFDNYIIAEARNKAKVFYQKELAQRLKSEMDEVIKKENKDA